MVDQHSSGATRQGAARRLGAIRARTRARAGAGLACLAALLVATMPAHAVKLGILTDMSGVVADATGRGSVVAAELAAEDMGGSLLGKPIEIISADHQFKPDVGSSFVRRWFDTENVDAIADLAVSPIAIAAQGIAKAKNKIVLISGSGTQVLFGANCAPTSFTWSFDTALQTATAALTSTEPGAKWFLISPGYSFGIEMEEFMRRQIAADKGLVVGSTRPPVGNLDFSSAITSAQASGANLIGFAQAGHDGIHLIQQAHEFNIAQSGQRLVAEFMLITDVHGVSLDVAGGMYLPTSFYWDANEATRAFSKRFAARMKRPPTELQAGVYSSVLHYLRAVKATGTTDATAVSTAMRATPVNDATITDGRIRADGRLVHDMYLMQVKTPAESRFPWDYYKVIRHVPAGELQSASPSPACKLG